MSKSLLWILLGIVAIVVFILVFNYVKKEARPIVPTPAQMEKLETGRLGPDDPVIITLDDGLYHRPGCPRIQGTTQKTVLRVVQEQDVTPCPYCIGEE